jgi:hypothetical protein
MTRNRQKRTNSLAWFELSYHGISDVGVGAVLLQEGNDDIDVLNCYYSLNFDKDPKN